MKSPHFDPNYVFEDDYQELCRKAQFELLHADNFVVEQMMTMGGDVHQDDDRVTDADLQEDDHDYLCDYDQEVSPYLKPYFHQVYIE